MTMSLVSSVTVGSGGASSIEFTSIPQDGTDLVLVCSLRSATTVINFPRLNLKINNLTSGYTERWLYGENTTVGGGSDTAQSFLNGFWVGTSSTSVTANTFANGSIYLANYTSNVSKTLSSDFVTEDNGIANRMSIVAQSSSGTSSITSLSLTDSTGSGWGQNSTASLYKITKGSGGASVS